MATGVRSTAVSPKLSSKASRVKPFSSARPLFGVSGLMRKSWPLTSIHRCSSNKESIWPRPFTRNWVQRTEFTGISSRKWPASAKLKAGEEGSFSMRWQLLPQPDGGGVWAPVRLGRDGGRQRRIRARRYCSAVNQEGYGG